MAAAVRLSQALRPAWRAMEGAEPDWMAFGRGHPGWDIAAAVSIASVFANMTTLELVSFVHLCRVSV